MMMVSRKQRRAAWLMSCALTALAAQQAQAQTQNPADVAEIVVTAQKREQRLQDVPISVNVVGSDQLDRQNVSSVSDLARSVPSLGSPNGTGGVSIRGVTTNGFARSSESAVAVVLDGVVLGRAEIDNLFDVERVEVLSGPQGTLFGKNASAGVINIITKAPDTSRFEVIAHADIGNYEYQRERLTLNVPLAETAAIRVGLYHRRQGGIVENTLTGNDRETYAYGLRGRLLFEPNEDLRINLIADWERSGDNGEAAATFGIAPTPALAARLAACGIIASPTNDKNCAEGRWKDDEEANSHGLSAQIDYSLPGDHVLTAITAGRWRKTGDFNYFGLGGDSDLLSTDILSTNLTPSDVQAFSQELRITSPSGRTVEYVAGLFLSDTQTRDQIFQAGTLGLVPPPLRIGRLNRIDIYQRSYAAFANVTARLTDQLTLNLGGRYTDELVKDSSTSATDLTALGVIATPGFFLAPVNERVKSDNFSWRIGVQYDWTPDVMTYVTASRGYKGPAVNDQASPPIAQTIIKPEIPMYYEAGAKTTILDGRLLATLALFHNKVKNFQTAVFMPATADNPVGTFGQGNAPHIVSKGVELNLFGRPTPELSFNAGLIYNDASYSSDFMVACPPGSTRGAGACSTEGTTSPVSQLAGTPKWRALVNGEYARNMAQNLVGFVQADLVYTSGFDFSSTPDPITRSGERWMLGGRVGVRTEDGRWGVSLFGRNLLGKTYPNLNSDPLGTLNGGGGRSYWTQPTLDWHRSYGVTLDARF